MGLTHRGAWFAGLPKILWEPTLVAIGGVAVVHRPAHFLLKERVDWITAAARQIATKVCSHRIEALQQLASNHRISSKLTVGEACEPGADVSGSHSAVCSTRFS